MDNVLKLDERRVEKVVGAILGLMGAWVAVSPLLLNYSKASSATINGLVVGVLVAIIGWSLSRDKVRDITIPLLAVAAGVWLMASPWVLAFNTNLVETINTVMFGGLIGVFALWSALAETGHRRIAAH